MLRFVVVSCFLNLSIASAHLHASETKGRPNIIVILIDDQEKTSIGAYGGKTYTPNLDRMAREGMIFKHAYVSSSVCTPSRYSFLTGRYAGNSSSKLYQNACGGIATQGFPSFNVALEADGMNVANVLRQAGYVTGFVGKFHLGSSDDFPEFHQRKEGLRRIPKNGAKDNAKTAALFRHNELVMRRYLQKLGFTWAKHIYPTNLQAPYNKHNPEWTIQAALEFIEQNKDRPFYLHCCTTLLHGGEGSWRKSMDYPLVSGQGPLAVLPKVMTPRKTLLKTLTAKGFDSNSPTAGEAWIDDAVGAILRKLQKFGIDDNTLVVFVADHGRDAKASLFAVGGTCVPCIMRWPSGIKGGVVCEEFIQNIDMAPTFFELAKAKVPSGYKVDGRSLRPLFSSGKAVNWRTHLYFEMGTARAVRTKEWSYIAVRYPKETIRAIKTTKFERLPRVMSYIGRMGIGTRGADHPGFFDADQLYDLHKDAKEMRNLSLKPKFASKLVAMRQLLTKHLKSIGRPFGEFIPGSNAAPPGQVDEQISQVKKLRIKGKTVTVP